MTRLDPSTYLSHIGTESRRFRDALAECEPTAPVPSCPEWAADDLLWHLTEVQAFWAHIIEHRPTGPDDYQEPDRPSDRAALLGAFDVASASLLVALEEANAEEPAWSWDEDQTVGFAFRRQAQEALIHRVDAEQTARIASSLDSELAADGVDEVLSIFYGGCPPWATSSVTPYVVEVVMTDIHQSIFVKPGQFSGTSPNSGLVYESEGMIEVVSSSARADAKVSGTSADVLLWLWDRADDRRLTLSGKSEALAAFAAGISSSLD